MDKKYKQAEELEAVKTNNTTIDTLQQLVTRPDLDADAFNRIDKYLDIQERIMNKNAEIAFNNALAEMQPELPIIKRKTKGYNSKYAAYENIMEPYLPLLSKYGFSLSYSNETIENGIKIFGTLAHKEGHQKTVDLSLPIDIGGHKNKLQAIGSTISYGKRYVSGMLLNVVTEGDDDDGHSGGSEPINEEQATNIRALISEVNADEKAFLKYMKSSSVDLILSVTYKQAVSALEKKRNQPQKE